MSRLPIDSDGITSTYLTDYNEDSGIGHLETIQSGRINGKIVDEFRSDSASRNQFAQGRLAARIPITVYNSWRKEWRSNHSDKWEWTTWLTMRLNSNDYAYLRNQKL